MRSPDDRYTVTKYGIADDEYRYELWDRKKSIAHGLPSAGAALKIWREGHVNE